MNQQQHKRPKPRPLKLLILSMLVALVLPLITGTLLSWHSLGELDVWLHQKAGQDILAGQGMPHLNSYSFTEPDHPWTNHEWLFQVLIAGTGPTADDLDAGINRWILLRAFLTLLLLGVLLAGDHPWRAPPLKLIWLAPAISMGVMLLWPRILLRPELLSYTLMVLLVRLAESPTNEPWSVTRLISPRSREAQAFMITLIWAQVHGFSALAPVIWLLAGVIGFLPGCRFPRTSPLRLSAGTALLLLALLLTPNGWQGLIYPLKAMGQFSTSTVDLQSIISELQPLFQTPDGLYLTILAFKVSLVWGVIFTIITWPRRNLLRTALWILAAAATMTAQRNIGFYSITFILMHTQVDAHQFINFRLGKKALKAPPALAAIPVIIVIAGTFWFLSGLISDDFYLTEGQSRRFGSGPTVARHPFQGAQLLARKPETRVFANVDAAALSLSLGKALVFIDGRTEAYSPETWVMYQQLRKGGTEALAALDRSGTRNVLLTIAGTTFHPLLRTLLDNDEWTVRHADLAGVLLSRPANPPTDSGSAALAAFAGLQTKSPSSSLSPTRQADMFGAQANLLNLAGQTEQGETRLRLGLALRPTHPQLNHNLGNILLQKGQLNSALEHFSKALDTNPRLAGSALNAGVCLMKTGDFAGAEKMFARVTRLQPENFQAWVNRSLALQQLGKTSKACDSMEEALRLNPGNPRLRQILREMQSQR